MASTAVPAVKTAIVEVLEGAKSLEGVTVTKGLEPTRETEWIWVWKAEATRDFKGLGPQPAPLDEAVSVHLRIVAVRGDVGAAEERATELFEATETALREATELNGAILWQRIEKFESEPLNFDSKAGFHYLPVVVGKARI